MTKTPIRNGTDPENPSAIARLSYSPDNVVPVDSAPGHILSPSRPVGGPLGYLSCTAGSSTIGSDHPLSNLRNSLVGNNQRKQLSSSSFGGYWKSELMMTRQYILTPGQRLSISVPTLASDNIRDAGHLHQIAFIGAVDKNPAAELTPVFGSDLCELRPALRYSRKTAMEVRMDMRIGEHFEKDLPGHLWLKRPSNRLMIMLAGANEKGVRHVIIPAEGRNAVDLFGVEYRVRLAQSIMSRIVLIVGLIFGELALEVFDAGSGSLSFA